ncbi:sulfurtransferase [Thalassobacillus sp. C254]|uniref:sulfurtransferase n=1 Tax=Thalassobacillus sp. C254 TaxID=1225341 RepID=UPI0006D03B81|nr:sulfurtransferase [Thalassobacillus sp. C254]
MSYLVTTEWLNENLHDENLRIVDCRFELGQPEQGRKEYYESHIPGAVHVDLEKDLSDSPAVHGGRHPLPDMEEFADFISELGIDKDTKVIAYDDQGGAMAARFWWMLLYLGHPNVYVLNQTFTSWKKKGYPVTEEIPSIEKRYFFADKEPRLLVHLEEVKVALHEEDKVLIDGRDEIRYKGIRDEVDPVAGHIPGARHYFWKKVLTEEGKWKESEELQSHFSGLSHSDEIISYCGSGVTAAANVLALKEAGFENVRLYAGSWSDWSSYPDLPYETDKS